ncbi:hypothetical protein D5086_007281 [Populus alba]|uniref:Uncharacterized protein n=1 Tax=Populus alba TaxID=43335 RepID=A0ACC4CMY8_POPAL
MQAAIFLAPPLVPPVTPNKSLASPQRAVSRLRTPKCPRSKQVHQWQTTPQQLITAPFPPEACETIGGEACDVEMYPEVKLKPEARNTPRSTSEQID